MKKDRPKIVSPILWGWREIAAYMGHCEKTVKNWGKERGLPVFQFPGKRAICAWPQQLELWTISVLAAHKSHPGASSRSPANRRRSHLVERDQRAINTEVESVGNNP